MKIQTTLGYQEIKMTEAHINDTYCIFQNEDGAFYITSDNGYDNTCTEGHVTLEAAMKHVKNMIKNYFIDRCEPNPKGW